MLETPHVIIGAAIATNIPNPYISLPLAFASHFLLERVPHWNPHLNTELKKHGSLTNKTKAIIAVDVITAFTAGVYLASSSLPDTGRFLTIIAASLLSVLPDLIEGPYFFFKWKSEFIKKWVAFQKSIQMDTGVLPGLFTQFVTILAGLWWIFN